MGLQNLNNGLGQYLKTNPPNSLQFLQKYSLTSGEEEEDYIDHDVITSAAFLNHDVIKSADEYDVISSGRLKVIEKKLLFQIVRGLIKTAS